MLSSINIIERERFDNHRFDRSLYAENQRNAMNSMISTLSGFAERLSLYVRDPLTALGMEVQNSVYSGDDSSINYPHVVRSGDIKPSYFTWLKIRVIYSRTKKCGISYQRL